MWRFVLGRRAEAVGAAEGTGALAVTVADGIVAVGGSGTPAGGCAATATDSVIWSVATGCLAVRTIHTAVAPTKAHSAKTPALNNDTSDPARGCLVETGRVMAPLPVGTSEDVSLG